MKPKLGADFVIFLQGCEINFGYFIKTHEINFNDLCQSTKLILCVFFLLFKFTAKFCIVASIFGCTFKLSSNEQHTYYYINLRSDSNYHICAKFY